MRVLILDTGFPAAVEHDLIGQQCVVLTIEQLYPVHRIVPDIVIIKGRILGIVHIDPCLGRTIYLIIILNIITAGIAVPGAHLDQDARPEVFYIVEEMPKEYSLNSNFPNPFNPTTQISYQIPKNGFVNLVVYNALGQEVEVLVNQHQSSGKYSVQFNASSLPSGVYIYKLNAGEFSSVKKMILTK